MDVTDNGQVVVDFLNIFFVSKLPSLSAAKSQVRGSQVETKLRTVLVDSIEQSVGQAKKRERKAVVETTIRETLYQSLPQNASIHHPSS